MSNYSYKKIDQKATAKHFLIEALRYYKKGDDLSCLIALSLAGISEELMGKMLIETGKETALENEKKGFSAVLKILNKKEKSDKELHDFLNKAKNTTKHDSGTIYLDPKSEASDMLNRAVRNFERYFDVILYESDDFKKGRKKATDELIRRVSEFKVNERLSNI